MHLTLAAHVVSLIRTADFGLCRISSVCHYLSVPATKTLLSAFILSRLDYCNSLLSGWPLYLLNRVQKVQNNTTRIVLKAAIQTILHLIFALCISSQSMLELNATFLLFTSVQWLLLAMSTSADSRILCIPLVNTQSCGERSFSYIAPTLWNTLPKDKSVL